MFGDMFGNLGKQQEELQQKLAHIFVEAEAGDGAVTVKAAANMHIENIKIDPNKTDIQDHEQLEDLVLVAVNRALGLAQQQAGEESAKLIKGMFPFGDLDQFLKGA